MITTTTDTDNRLVFLQGMARDQKMIKTDEFTFAWYNDTTFKYYYICIQMTLNFIYTVLKLRKNQLKFLKAHINARNQWYMWA